MPKIKGIDISGYTVGQIIDIGHTTLPYGVLLCTGIAVSRTTYAALFAKIGTTYGVGDGSTTFNLPNLERSVTVGSGGTGTSTLGSTVGSAGGEESHTLSSAESGLPAHSHTYSDPTHSHSAPVPVYQTNSGTGPYGDGLFWHGGDFGYYGTTGSSVGITINNSAASAASASHNNIQPSLVVTKAIAYV